MIGIGFCTKTIDQDKKTDNIDIMAMPGNRKLVFFYFLFRTIDQYFCYNIFRARK